MIDETRVYSKLVASGLIGIGLFYAVMTTYQLASGAPSEHSWAFGYPLHAIMFFVVVPILFILGTRYPKFKLPAIIAFHIGGMNAQIWFTEVYSPFTVVWSMYIVITMMYFGWWGFVASASCLVVSCVWYVVAFSASLKPSPDVYIMLSALVVTITIATAYLFSKIIKIGRDKNVSLADSQKRELVRANQLDALLNTMREPVVTVDGTNIISSQNEAVQILFNIKASFVGQQVDDVFKLKTRDGTPKMVSELISATPLASVRDDLILMSGTMERFVEVQVTRIRQAEGIVSGGTVLQVRDITKQKTLDDEKDEFISVTSHELRTPIATIEGCLSNIQILRKKRVDDDRLDEAITTAQTQIISLARIVNDISTISRAEMGDGDSMKDVDLAKLLLDIQTKYKSEADRKSLVLRLEIQENVPMLTTSYTYLTGIIENFVKNALKYTREGGITIKAGLLDDGRVYCDVIDTGIGISDEDKTRIFDKFYRSEDYRTRETGGTGLGLYEAKILATKIDAYIQVVSEPGRGSVFRLTLPMKVIKYSPTITQATVVKDAKLIPA